MIDADKLLRMFKEVNGEMTGACSARVYYNADDDDIGGVCVEKHGDRCWSETTTDIVFNFLTKDWV